jgi:hypothetical protein
MLAEIQGGFYGLVPNRGDDRTGRSIEPGELTSMLA